MMVKGRCADVRICRRGNGQKTDVDVEDIHFLPIVLSHAFGPITSV